MQDSNTCRNFRKQRKKNYDAETGLDLTDDESMQIALGDGYGGRILG
jgi:hypothetical protein